MKSIVGKKEEEQEDCEAGAWETMRKPCELHKCMSGFTPQSAKCGSRVTLLFCRQVWMQKPIPLSSPHSHSFAILVWSHKKFPNLYFLSFSLKMRAISSSRQAGWEWTGVWRFFDFLNNLRFSFFQQCRRTIGSGSLSNSRITEPSVLVLSAIPGSKNRRFWSFEENPESRNCQFWFFGSKFGMREWFWSFEKPQRTCGFHERTGRRRNGSLAGSLTHCGVWNRG